MEERGARETEPSPLPRPTRGRRVEEGEDAMREYRVEVRRVAGEPRTWRASHRLDSEEERRLEVEGDAFETRIVERLLRRIVLRAGGPGAAFRSEGEGEGVILAPEGDGQRIVARVAVEVRVCMVD